MIIVPIDKPETITVEIGPVVFGNDASAPKYYGPYDVRPKAFSETVLETKGKEMRKNVRILEIPYFEVGNANDGKTVYIGGESEIL